MRQILWRATLRGYLLLPHLVPVIVVELATLGFAIIAWHGLPPARLLVPMLLGMLGGQLAIGATNELADLPFDAAGKPDKPLVSGVVPIRGARAMVAVGLAMMTGFGLLLGVPAFALLALGTGLGIAYDLWWKRSLWSWLPYFLALPLLPIWVFVALGKPEPRLFLLYPLGALATVGVHLAQALPDVAIDRQAGFRTPTSRLGSRATFALAWFAAVSAPLLAFAAARMLGIEPPLTAIAAAGVLAAALLLVNLALVVANRPRGVSMCFPLVALSTVASALAWTLTVAM